MISEQATTYYYFYTFGMHVSTTANLIDAGEGYGSFTAMPTERVDARGWPGAAHVLSPRLKHLTSNLATLKWRSRGIQLRARFSPTLHPRQGQRLRPKPSRRGKGLRTGVQSAEVDIVTADATSSPAQLRHARRAPARLLAIICLRYQPTPVQVGSPTASTSASAPCAA